MDISDVFFKQGRYASPGFSQAWKASSLPVQDAGVPHAAVGGQEQAVTNSKDLKAGQKKPPPTLGAAFSSGPSPCLQTTQEPAGNILVWI